MFEQGGCNVANLLTLPTTLQVATDDRYQSFHFQALSQCFKNVKKYHGMI